MDSMPDPSRPPADPDPFEALRESESRFKTLFEQSPDAIFVEDPSGTVLDVNPAGCTLHGLPRDRLVGRNVLDLVPRQSRPNVLKDYEKWFTGELSYFEGVSLAADGRSIEVEIRANPIEYAGRKAVLLLVRDISTRKHVEAEREKLVARLVDSQENERERISELLKSQITPLLQQAEIDLQALDSSTPERSAVTAPLKSLLDKAIQGLQHLSVSLHPPLLDGVGLEAALGVLTESFTRNGIETTFSRIGPAVHISAGAKTCMYRALQEALTNASRHARATQVDVTLNTQTHEVCLEVKDNGRGMADPDSTVTRGLGLIGIRERLRRFEGRLAITSQRGAGTAIRICLPLLKNADPGPLPP